MATPVININETIKRKKELVKQVQAEIKELREQRTASFQTRVTNRAAIKAERAEKAKLRKDVKDFREGQKLVKAAEKAKAKAKRVADLKAKLKALEAKKEPVTKEALKKAGAATGDHR